LHVTGTNGKTTTARLIDSLFRKNLGLNQLLGGVQWDADDRLFTSGEKAQVVIAEVSSYMLELCETFNPQNIVFMNLAENHLDRYRSMEEYVNARDVFSKIPTKQQPAF
jgi:UDP-N-acetylmuramoylalanine--D-glutamate ligase